MARSPLQDLSENSVQPLNIKTKLAFGSGELGKEMPGSILVFYILFFLTNVAGLNPALAGGVLMVGRIWDAISDPMIGWLSDRTHSRWGRRYPWMLFGAVPLGLCFCLQWWVPPTPHPWALFGYYSLMAILLFTALTAVAIPHAALAAELTQGYDERTNLASFKSSFSIGSSILGLVLAQFIFALIADDQRQYLILGGVIGALCIISVGLCVWGTHQRYWRMHAIRQASPPDPSLSIWRQIQIAFSNRPFVYLVGIYLFSWVGLQVSAAILPYFVVNVMALAENHFTQMALAVQGTALTMMLFWGYLGQRIGKRAIYCLGIPVTLVALVGFFLLQPGQILLMYGLGVMVGMGLSTAYLVPWSMLPDVIDLDELNTSQRREGIFCGFLIQVQKLGTALSIFLVGKTLDWAGFVSSVAGQAPTPQPESALWAIRWLMGPVPGLILAMGVVAAVFYPISRDVHQSILLKLSQREAS
ncbi:MAG: MFS transporter [Leptolyngbyaceae cyanobacterium MO_188.B28]|nr:MFS transporter [Leptolyngbyaceae cyanobacterium MO_188.B28]